MCTYKHMHTCTCAHTQACAFPKSPLTSSQLGGTCLASILSWSHTQSLLPEVADKPSDNLYSSEVWLGGWGGLPTLITSYLSFIPATLTEMNSKHPKDPERRSLGV